ncbi:Hsp20/alpha crystallin family protein [Candidatus Saccharibacteria bacterium]|nr:Hsp20/alpha crystallin family protein [Candidatus Saccharibacteria bacterium]
MSKIVRFDPFRELNSLQRQLMGDDWMTPLGGASFPTTDVYTDDDKNLVVEAHLPNFKNEDIDVHVDDGALIIQAERHEREEDKKRKYVVRESSSSFYRRIQLPERADSNMVEAHLDDGILKVVVPLMVLPEPKKIAIKSKSK